MQNWEPNLHSSWNIRTIWETGTVLKVDTLDKIQERRNKKAAISTRRKRAQKVEAKAGYTELNRSVKRITRTDKCKNVKDLTMTAEKFAREGRKSFSGNYRKPERSVKGKEGKVTINIEEQRNRCVENFKELLNPSAQ
ncbi:unnamed protein product [Schistosoma margrebowiei]|uniref:Uncharacterized protein n=1 Tax=Schistosoma margrebowiei TaxID=48269 RepID=A0A183LBU5_9TREM|nr:unnamed protein product [Schistosoma margrebowiei]